MIKSIKIEELRVNGLALLNEWNDNINDVHLTMKSMYALLKLKKSIENEFNRVNDLIRIIAEKYGATINQDGSFKIPQEHIAEANKELDELGQTDIDFEYTPVTVKEEDNIPPKMFEAILDFVELED